MKFLFIGVFIAFAQLLLSQNTELNHNQDLWPRNTVIHYEKSNWDGTNKGRVSIYFGDYMSIESIKWHEKGRASIVPAKIDPQTLSVASIQSIRFQDGAYTTMGEMTKDPDSHSYFLRFGDFRDTLSSIPEYWHSYDFDWASLMVAFLFKSDTSRHSFSRCDFQMVDNQPSFIEIGEINMEVKGERTVDHIPCIEYAISGSGLNHKGGQIWFSRDKNLLMGFKIEQPDEDSYQNVLFTYVNLEKMNPSEWKSFKKSICIQEGK